MCIFGMHGSFILVQNSIEKKEGFNLHPRYCITEDAYWGLKMMQKGYKFGNVHGFLHEQSPQKSSDFIKQRRRWFIGLTQILHAKDISFRYKFILFISMRLWALSGFVVIYTAFNILHPVPIPMLVGLLSSLSFAIYIVMYLIGFYMNMKHAKISLLYKLGFLITQLFLMPIFSILESLGAIYGIVNRKLDYYVIKK
jgi:beta-1,4-mannosyltransferase